jgi:hypothetical protein
MEASRQRSISLRCVLRRRIDPDLVVFSSITRSGMWRWYKELLPPLLWGVKGRLLPDKQFLLFPLSYETHADWSCRTGSCSIPLPSPPLTEPEELLGFAALLTTGAAFLQPEAKRAGAMNGFSSFLRAFKKSRSLAFLHKVGPFPMSRFPILWIPFG